MPVRPTGTWSQYSAYCADCGWESRAANAHGNAARHHDKTGHEVSVEIQRYVIYGKRDGES